MLDEEVNNFLPFDPGSEFCHVEEQLSSIEGTMDTIVNTDIITTDAVIAMESIRPGMLMDIYPQNGWGNKITKRELVIAMEELTAGHRGLIAIAVGALVAAVVKLIMGWGSEKKTTGSVSDSGKKLTSQTDEITDAAKKAKETLAAQQKIEWSAIEAKRVREYERLAKALSVITGKPLTGEDLHKDVTIILGASGDLADYEKYAPALLDKICCNFMIDGKLGEVIEKLDTAVGLVVKGLPEKIKDYEKFADIMKEATALSSPELKEPVMDPLFVTAFSPVIGGDNKTRESEVLNALHDFLGTGFAMPSEIKIDSKKLESALSNSALDGHLKSLVARIAEARDILKKNTDGLEKWKEIAQTADKLVSMREVAAVNENDHHLTAKLRTRVTTVKNAAQTSLKSLGHVSTTLAQTENWITSLHTHLDKLIKARSELIEALKRTIVF